MDLQCDIRREVTGDAADFKIQLHMGSGGFASVYDGIEVESNRQFAIKVMNMKLRDIGYIGSILTLTLTHPTGDWWAEGKWGGTPFESSESSGEMEEEGTMTWFKLVRERNQNVM